MCMPVGGARMGGPGSGAGTQQCCESASAIKGWTQSPSLDQSRESNTFEPLIVVSIFQIQQD
eukprot:10898392-Ditylum_brightwellii.AAC.1